MRRIKALRCRECGSEYPIEPLHVCEYCFGPLEVEYDYDALSKLVTHESIAKGPTSLWRYYDLLPVDSPLHECVDLGGGFTPLVEATRLGEKLGVRRLYIKNDTVNPTWSFKDRVVSVAVTKAKEFGFDTVACASTGNLANSLAAHAAKVGMRCFVFVPADIELSKVVGSLVYGPQLVAVEGNYDEVNRLCVEVASRFGWAFVNINIRPYYSEGSKTIALEVLEQLNWKAPEHIVVPVASGSLLTKVWKGIKECYRIGLIESVRTKVHGAQPSGCAPVVNAFKLGASMPKPVKPQTIVKSLAIGNPADGIYALRAIRESGGVAEEVTDEEVVEAIKLLAETEGIWAETAGGVTIAVLKKLIRQGIIKRDELTVALVTGSGIKTSEVVCESLREPIRIQPRLKAFEEALQKLQL
ncbi:MAG: threonine synthase [Armatimonadota bacterium]|nr:threonine synthase [Armatimonadota bacterium]MCX7778341.1 threonine synthase [Armatimonadota bacterium]MDW8026407.1 threonine synthase [Armatimonadota bacterium]